MDSMVVTRGFRMMRMNGVKLICVECVEIMQNESIMNGEQYIFTCPVCKDQFKFTCIGGDL